MNTDDLREQFFKEHPNSKMDKCIMPEDVGYDYFTDDYVLWLEEKLILYNVVVPEGTLCEHPFNKVVQNNNNINYCSKCDKAI
jgi:hypothetical protein